jgi:Nucleoside 2-deoxyribosyltransferase
MENFVIRAFVSMPYGKDAKSKGYWQRFYVDGIVGMAPLFEGRGYAVEFHRPKEEPSALILKDSVRKLLDRCDVCLAIITGLNPNVFWEVGYAVAKGKPVVFAVIAEGVDEAQYAPVLVADALKVYYDGKVFDQQPLNSSSVQNFQYDLLRFLDVAKDIVKGLEKPAAQYRVLSDRTAAKLPEAVAGAKRSIDLITTNLSYFADVSSFVVNLDGKSVYAFDPPVNRGVRVRILALNPDSVIAEYRAKQLGLDYDVAGYREELRSAARFFYLRYLRNKKVDIRIYDDLPLQITALIDDRVITSIVSRGQQARNNVHVDFDLEYSGARASFEKHFAEVLASQAQTFHITKFSWVRDVPPTTSGEGGG